MLRIKSIEQFETWLAMTEEVYLYGAGAVCRQILEKTEYMNMRSKVKGVLVTKMKGNQNFFCNISVMPFEKIEQTADTVILIAVSPRYRDEIEEILIGKGANNVVALSDDFEMLMYQNLDAARKKYLENLETKIIEFSKKSQGAEKKRDVLFLTPPYWDVYSPFSAVPCLVAKLRQDGLAVDQCDIGIYCIHHLIKKRWREIADYCMTESFYNEQIKDYRNNYYLTWQDYCKGMKQVWQEDFSVERVKKNYQNLNAVQRRVLDAFYLYIYLSDISNIDFDNCSELEENILQWNKQELLETLADEKVGEKILNVPAVVAISVTSTCQFIPGCILADIIRKCRPDVTIIMGGSCADIFLKSEYEPKVDIEKYFDYVIVGEGETALLKLLHYLRGKGTIEEVPNLLRFDEKGSYRCTFQMVEEVDGLPAPDYSGLDLDLYLSPELVLPYQTSRGCHYGCCAFCNHDEKYRHNYRTKRMDKVVEELLVLSQEYKTNYFQFVDEAIRPDCFREMIEEMDMHDEFKNMKWIYYSRVSRLYDEELMKKARKNGCEMVMFGVESFNQRILNFIKKGISAEVSRYCLELFHNCGIKTYAWLMCNLPSETVEEARRDMEDVKEMLPYIDAFSVGPFFLSRNTDMYENRERYNIISVDETDQTRFQSHNNGVLIDKDKMLDFFENEYAKLQNHYFGMGNRYTLFFE